MSPLSSPLEAQDGVRCGYARAGAQNEERNIDQEIVVANTAGLTRLLAPARPPLGISLEASGDRANTSRMSFPVRPSVS